MAGQGYYQVRAYTSEAQLPVYDVTVSLERALPGGGYELLNVQMTDRDGMTAPVAVQTPDAEQSRQPEQGRGWSDVVVFADHPLYERIQVRQEQIFPGITTVQNLELIPFSELPQELSESEMFVVPPQLL